MFGLKHKMLASAAGFDRQNTYGLHGTTTNSVTNIENDYTIDMLEDFIDGGRSELSVLYREIYNLDYVSGSAVDILSTVPYSDLSIHGVNDPTIRKLYEDSLNELNIREMMQKISIPWLVLGQSVSSLIFDDSRGIFTDVIHHNPDDVEIVPIPLQGYDPKINLKVNPEFRKFLTSGDPRDQEARKELSTNFIRLMQGAEVPLEPLSTIYVSRTAMPGSFPTSIFNRILPIWLIEKALTRGTILGAWNRQRSILHVTVGNEENWEPTPQQLHDITSLFISANADPQGAVVTTRIGVETNEVRNGSDFWRITDDMDMLSAAKMKALNVDEAILTGNASFNSLDQSMTIILEKMRDNRDFLTERVFYNKIFLNIAKANGFKKRTQAELSSNIRTDGYKKAWIKAEKIYSLASQYEIPEVKWKKHLQPFSDREYFDMLISAQEAGLVIPRRLFYQAVGQDFDQIVETMGDDIEARRNEQTYLEEIDKVSPQEEEGDMFSSVRGKFDNVKKAKIRKNVQHPMVGAGVETVLDPEMAQKILDKNQETFRS